MIHTNTTTFKRNLFKSLEQTIKYNEPISISTNNGNVVLISESDYNGLVETVYLQSIPGLKESIIEESRNKSEFIDESKVDW